MQKTTMCSALALSNMLQADGAFVDQGGGHVPVADDHAEVVAVVAGHGLHEIFDGRGIEIADVPAAGFAHDFFAAELVKFQDQCGVFLFGH